MWRELIEYRRLSAMRGWTPCRIRDRQNELFRRIVRHAYQNVPFYRRSFQSHGVVPSSIESIDDLCQLPVCRKKDLKECVLADRVVGHARLDRMERVSTSGSTGIPLQIAFSGSEGARRRACLLRTFVDLGAPLWHKRLTLKPKLRPTQKSFLHRLVRFNHRTCIEELAIEEFRRFCPSVLAGLPTLLHVFALNVRAAAAKEISPQLIVPSGEMLLPDTERLLLDTFHAPVRPYYGCWEFGVVATWCDQAMGYHLVTDNLLVECLRDGEPLGVGESGELALTGLTSTEMPFIRYCPGDLCELYFETCDCGRTGPTIRNIQGREDDFLTMRDGRLVPPMISIKPLFDLDCLNQYRVIQESFEGYRIEYSGVRELTVAERMRIRAHFETTLGADDVCFERYAELPRDSSGKLRKIVSRISDPHSFS